MDPSNRAERLRDLGLLPPAADPAELARRAEAKRPELLASAPASALLGEAGQLLEIEPDAAASLSGYEEVLRRVVAFCGDPEAVADVKAKVLTEKELHSGGEPDDGLVVSLSFRLGGSKTEVEITHYPDLIDLGFLGEVDRWLVRRKSARRLCPVVEALDDVARYLFAEPALVDRAYEEGLITEPEAVE